MINPLSSFLNLSTNKKLFLSSLTFALLLLALFSWAKYYPSTPFLQTEKGQLEVISPKNEPVTDILAVLTTYKHPKSQKEIVGYLRINNGPFRLIKYKKISDTEVLFRTTLNVQKLKPGTYPLSIYMVDITNNSPELVDYKTVNFEIKR